MIITLLLIIVGLILQSLFIKAEIDGKMKAAVILKGTASLMFVLLGVFLITSKITMYGDLILKGLIFGMFGDILLNLRYLVPEQKGSSVFGLGVLSFIVGHIFYIAALVDLGGTGILLYSLIFTIIISVVVVLLMKKHIPIEKKYIRVCSYIYIIVVVAMLSSAISLILVKIGRASCRERV